MDTENLKKLLLILETLDRYKKNFAAFSNQSSPKRQFSKSHFPFEKKASSAGDTAGKNSVRSVLRHQGISTRLSKSLARSSSFVAHGSRGLGTQQMARAMKRRMTIKRMQTLLVRRQKTIRKSCPELPQLVETPVGVEGLDEQLQERLRSIHKEVTKALSGETYQASEEDGSAEKWETLSESNVCGLSGSNAGGSGVSFDEEDEDTEMLKPDFSFESMGSYDLKLLAEADVGEFDLSLLTPNVLSRLFDKVLECLQTDFKELIERLQAQNGHLKQDLISVQKRLKDAVETNDEQVQELKEMAERVADLEAESRELNRQLGVMERQLKVYTAQDKASKKDEELWREERKQLKARVTRLSAVLSAQEEAILQRKGSTDEASFLQSVAQKHEEKLKALSKQLEAKDREIASLSDALVSLQQQQLDGAAESSRASGKGSPRAISDYLYPFGLSSSRRTIASRSLLSSVRHSADAGRSPFFGPSLAGELEEARKHKLMLSPLLTSSTGVEKQFEAAQKMLQGALTEVERLRDENQSLGQQVEKLRQMLQEKTAAATAALDSKSLLFDEEGKKQKKLLLQLQSELEEAHTLYSGLTAEIANLRINQKELKRRLAEAAAGNNSSNAEQLHEQLLALENRLMEKSRAAAEAEKTKQLLQTKVSAQENQIRLLNEQRLQLKGKIADDIVRLKQQLTEHQAAEIAEIDHPAASLQSLESEAEDTRSLITRLSQRVQELEEQLHTKKQQTYDLEAVQAVQSEVAALREQLAVQQSLFDSSRAELEQQLAAVAEESRQAAKQLQQQQTELACLEAMKERAEQLQLQLDAAATDARNKAAEEAEKLQAVTCKFEMEIRVLKAQAQELKEQCDMFAAEREILQQREAELSEKLARLQQQFKCREAELQAALNQAKEKEAAELLRVQELQQQKRLLTAEEAEEQLKHKCSHIAELVSKVETVQRDVERQQRINVFLCSRLPTSVVAADESAAAAAAEALVAKAAQLEEERDTLQELLEDMQTKFSRETQQRNALIEALTLENKELEAAVAAVKDSTTAQLQGVLPCVVEVEEKLRSDIRLMQEAHSRLQEENSSLIEQNKELEQALRRANAEVHQLTAAHNELQEDHGAASRNLTSVKERLAELLEERRNLQATAIERVKLGAVLQQMAGDISLIRSELLSSEGKLLKKEPQTTIFNVGFPENVIPVVNAHGAMDSSNKTVNISGMYDVRMGEGTYTSFASRNETLHAKLSRIKGSAILDSLREILQKNSLCSGYCCGGSNLDENAFMATPVFGFPSAATSLNSNNSIKTTPRNPLLQMKCASTPTTSCSDRRRA